MSFYEVLVGNIGAVHKGSSKAKALSVYNTYVRQSKSGIGRAGGEEVTLWKDGDIIKEYAVREPGYESNPRRGSLNKWIRAKKIRVRRSGGRLLLDIKR